MSKIKLLGTFYILTIVFLFLYSFTQVDLNLTLSQFSLWQIAQKFFQHIGYFNRPLSTSFYIIIVLLLFGFYLFFLSLASKNKINKKQVWLLSIISTVILSFSYNAFSYDLFNYMFDARIITHYGQNPYLHKALDYSSDPMLNFMRWTHRTYPYGPAWLVLTAPLSFIGFNFFLPTFFLFKFLGSLSFLGTAYFTAKILKKISPKNELFGLSLFVFNPLIIIEGLVSSHNDLPMIFLAVLSLHLLVSKVYIKSFLFLLFSVGIKFATVFLLPVFLYPLFAKNKNQINWAKIFNFLIPLMAIPLILVTVRTNFQPWYLLYIAGLSPFLQNRYYSLIVSTVFPFFALLEYVPFLYKGDWNQPVPNILFWLTIIGAASSIILLLGKPLLVKLSASNNK